MNELFVLYMKEVISKSSLMGYTNPAESFWGMYCKMAATKLSRECLLRDWYPKSIITMVWNDPAPNCYLLEVRVTPGYLKDFKFRSKSVLSNSALEEYFTNYITEQSMNQIDGFLFIRPRKKLTVETPTAYRLMRNDKQKLLTYQKKKKEVKWRIINRGKSV